MDILKYPPFSEGCLVRKVSCAKRSSTRCSAGAAMKKADMGSAQFGQQFAHGLFKIVSRVRVLNHWAASFYRSLPVFIKFLGRIEPLLQRRQDVIENGTSITRGDLDSQCRAGDGIHCHRLLLEER